MKALDAAKLVIATQGTDGKQITHLSLQKLLFYCHAYHLAFLDKPLIEDDKVQAWAYGPVFPSVYEEYNKFGSAFIPSIEMEENAESESLEIISLVLTHYGNFSPMALVNLTHQESPWIDSYQPKKNNVIENDVIKNYYSKFISRSNVN